MSAGRPIVSAIGIASLDHVILSDHYPQEGGFTFVQDIRLLPGGTTANSAVAAARLGAEVRFAGRVGEDSAGDRLISSIAAEGIDTSMLLAMPDQPTDETIVVVSLDTKERTIFWNQGARIARGMRVDIDALFSAGACLIDVVDLPLYRFLVDLPVHTRPAARLIGGLTYLIETPQLAMTDIIPRLDVAVGSMRDAQRIGNSSSEDETVERLRELMTWSNLRFAALTLGDRGALGITRSAVWSVEALPVTAVDTTGAGDAFAGALAFGIAAHLEPEPHLQLCSVTAALATTAVGAQTALPRMDEVQSILFERPPLVKRWS